MYIFMPNSVLGIIQYLSYDYTVILKYLYNNKSI